MDCQYVKEFSDNIINEVSKIMIGKEEQTKLILMAMFSYGHVLLEDMPGSGKTTLVKCISRALDMDFKRIQFTPDLLPSDITGMNIFNKETNSFKFVDGPVNTNILLADEINRAIPRTQSALLEAMEERQITIDGESRPLPEPFTVLATQNPVDSENTFALPAAQMDRFFIKLSLGYPDPIQEVRMITNLGDGIDFSVIEKKASPKDIINIKNICEKTFVSDPVKNYIVSLVSATRENPLIKNGASPRASRSLYKGAKAYAAISGRDFVTPDDIKEIAPYILTHRITLSNEARFARKTAEEIITEILNTVPVPPEKESMIYE